MCYGMIKGVLGLGRAGRWPGFDGESNRDVSLPFIVGGADVVVQVNAGDAADGGCGFQAECHQGPLVRRHDSPGGLMAASPVDAWCFPVKSAGWRGKGLPVAYQRAADGDVGANELDVAGVDQDQPVDDRRGVPAVVQGVHAHGVGLAQPRWITLKTGALRAAAQRSFWQLARPWPQDWEERNPGDNSQQAK